MLKEIKNPLEIQELIIPKIREKQCLVKIMYSSVCKSQVMEINGGRGKDKYLPHLLGHEASGVIISKHHSVKNFSVGDEVILSWIKNNKIKTENIIYLNNKGQKINSGPITTFGNYSVVYENCIYKKPKFLDFKTSALLGCAIPTGYGLVDNEIKSHFNCFSQSCTFKTIINTVFFIFQNFFDCFFSALKKYFFMRYKIYSF